MSKDKSEEVYKILAKDHPSQDEFMVLLEHVSPGVLAKRYLLTGLPFVFKDQPHQYLAFREAAGRIFRVPQQQISVMGSARFGFSNSPSKHKDGKAKLLDDNSDMDLVVISPEIFHRSLVDFADFSFKRLRDHQDLRSDNKKESDRINIEKGTLQSIRNRSKALSFGYVSPSDLEDGSDFKQQLYDMQRDAATQLFGTAPPGPIKRIGARIYRDWSAAERAYEFSYMQLARSLGLTYTADSAGPEIDDHTDTAVEHE